MQPMLEQAKDGARESEERHAAEEEACATGVREMRPVLSAAAPTSCEWLDIS